MNLGNFRNFDYKRNFFIILALCIIKVNIYIKIKLSFIILMIRFALQAEFISFL